MRPCGRLVGVTKRGSTTLALLLVLTACAADLGTDPSATPPSALATRGASEGVPPFIGEDFSPLTDYANAHADEFAGLFIDPPGGRTFVMLFTANVEEHAAAVAAIASNVTVRGARFTETELTDLLASLVPALDGVDGLGFVSAGIDTKNNVVTLEVKTDDPTFEVRTELQYGGRLDVTVYPEPGPWANTNSGDGWRLIAAVAGSNADAHAVRAATDAASLAATWERLGFIGSPPAVDFTTEVVAIFLHGIGSSCPELRLDGVSIVDGEVMSVVSDPLGPRACTADLVGAVAFVVALERDALPADGFTLWLSEDARAYTEPVDVVLGE